MKDSGHKTLALLPPVLMGLVVVGLVVLGLSISRPAIAQTGRGKAYSDEQGLVVAATDATTAVVWISPTVSTVSPGEEFTVAVRVSGTITDVMGYDFRMAWNTVVLSVTDVEDAGWLGSTGRQVIQAGSDIDNEAGTLRFGVISVGEPLGPDAPGPLAVVTLQAVGVGTSTLHLYDVTLFHSDGSGVPPDTLEDGMVEMKRQIFLPLILRDYP